VLHKSNQETNEEDIPRNAKFKGKKVDVKGSIELSYCLRGSAETHAILCYITKEWDPHFDVVIARGNLPRGLRQTLKRGG
jgi:hypothetical protein